MATQSESVSSGEIKKFIDALNAGLEKSYTKATTDLGPWKKDREEAIKITKPRIGVWPVDPAVKTIGDLFAYVFFDPDGAKFRTPPAYQIPKEQGGFMNDPELQTQYNDWINDMNGGNPPSPNGALVPDVNIARLFRKLGSGGQQSGWDGDKKFSLRPIFISNSSEIIKNYNEIKKPGITNPDKYSPGQWWFDEFMSDVVGLNGRTGYLKSDENRSNNPLIRSLFFQKFLDNNKKIVENPQTLLEGDKWKNDVYTISVSKFVNDTIPYSAIRNGDYVDYGYVSGDKGYGFAKILSVTQEKSKYTNTDGYTVAIGGGYGGINIYSPNFIDLRTKYRAGVNSLESLSKDPLFRPSRIDSKDDDSNTITWTSTGTQSIETGVYWTYEGGSTASSIEGGLEHILLYNAFLEAGDNYKTITIPRNAPVPAQVDPPVVSTLVPTTESKLSGEFTFNVEKRNTFVVVGNQNFALKIGDLVIEGLTTSSTPVIDSPKTIDLGDGIILIDDGESGEDIYSEEPFQGLEEQDLIFEGAEYKESIGTEVEYKTPVTNSAPGPNEGTKGSEVSYKDPSGMSPEEWVKTGPIVDGSKVPSNLSGPPKYNQKVSMNKTITAEYLPVIKKIPGYSNGIKLLAILMAQKEGFSSDKGGTRSYRTNNPGNIGNTDSGNNKILKTLEAGIKLQLEYITKVVSGTHPAYPVGKVKKMKPHYSPESKFYSPGYTFLYTGKIEQYCKIYATGARTTNSYITMIVSWFRQNGYNWVHEETTVKELVDQNSPATILS